MMVSIEGLVSKTQKALCVLRDRIQQVGLAPSPSQYKQMEVSGGGVLYVVGPHVLLAGERTADSAENRPGCE